MLLILLYLLPPMVAGRVSTDFMQMADRSNTGRGAPYPDEEEIDIDDDLAALEEQLEPPVQLDTTWKTVIVVDNTPVVGMCRWQRCARAW